MEYGIIGFIPVIAILVIAIKTKRTASALLIATVLSFIIMNGIHFIQPFIDLAYKVGTSIDTVWIFLLIAFLFILLSLLEEIGGSKAFAHMLKKVATSPRKTLIWSWIVALILFIDNTLSNAVLGTFSPIYDEHKIPRAALSYIEDSTAAPLAAIVPITSWAIFYQGVFGGYKELAYLGSGMNIYINVIPFLFYAWIAIILVFLFVIGVIPPIGEMKKTYKHAEETGELYSEASKKYNLIESNDTALNQTDSALFSQDNDRSSILRFIVFIVAIVFLTVGVIVTKDILTVSAVVSAIVIIIALVTKLSTWSSMMEASGRGLVNTLPLITILFAAYMFKDAIMMLGLPDYLIAIAKPYMSAGLFPFCTFVLCCILTFTTGSNWGITAVYATIGVPLCIAIGANPILVIAAIVSGATFGAHVCFYADYTVQSSILSKIDNMEHCLTQLPYGLIGGTLAAVSYLIAGLML